MTDESKETQQENELTTLRSIYFDSVVDNRNNIPWKVWRPLDLSLTLLPLDDFNVKDVHCSVTLHIKCCADYPSKPPIIEIQKMNGLSTENANQLLLGLESIANTKSQEMHPSIPNATGVIMIYELAEFTRQFLYEHNRPTLSFYEEMLKTKNEMEKIKLQNEQTKDNEERQKLKEEIEKRKQMFSSTEAKKSSVSVEKETTGDKGDASELIFYADNKTPANIVSRRKSVDVCTCNVRQVQILRITQRNNKKVFIGNCIGHSSNGATTYMAIDDETGDRLIARMWPIPPAGEYQTRTKQMAALQRELHATARLRHASLVPYTCTETVRAATTRVYVFREFVMGATLKFVAGLRVGDRFEALRLARAVGAGVLGALCELHGAGVPHRDVRAEHVFLPPAGGVRLVGAALDARLAEMTHGETYCDRQTMALDIYSTAQMLLSIVSQERTNLEIPSDLPTSAKDFFSRCLTEDEHSQWSAEQLANHNFLVDAPVKQPSDEKTDDAGSGSEDEDPVENIHRARPLIAGHSRLDAEFEILKWLGKGAFGDVLKVKNKLDGGFYAIKRIKLNPENVQLNKKITREVKLLSRLNHGNVVRYYNAWIESSSEIDDDASSTATKTSMNIKNGSSLDDVVAKLGQEVKVEWSMSEGPVQIVVNSSDSEDNDDDDEDDEEKDPWYKIKDHENDESSDGIEFKEDLNNPSRTMFSEQVATTSSRSEGLTQVLYIQMEFCEKHTLREAIDLGLYKENFRAWRLFREIVEGLAHVHQRGMIHRDLKPVNIFLDSNDHVKIGDFGLATKAFSTIQSNGKTKPEEIAGCHTGKVGTLLYVAPELLQSATKVIYNQKVDIYSLGIILFEMLHPPFETGMERIKILTDLRTNSIKMPESFQTEENSKQIQVIQWLLQHEASGRPTCAELMASGRVPRPVAEGALAGLVEHALAARGGRAHRRLVAACLAQAVPRAEDLTYHGEAKPRSDELPTVKDVVFKIFRSHGAVEFSPPLLTPRAEVWDRNPNAVKVMTASGAVCHLPHDMRLPFARHIAYTGTKYMRRYVIDRVYRERHVLGFHPREIVECAFDIVTPKTDSLWYDAELMVVASRAAAACNLKVTLQVNHTELLKTLLISCGVPLDKQSDMYAVLVDISFGRITSIQLQTHLASLCVTACDVANLVRLMESEVRVEEARELVAPLVRAANRTESLDRALAHLGDVCAHATALGCECQITLPPLMAYNAAHYNGIFWQMLVNRPNKPKGHNRSGDLIAAGGRYDELVEQFRGVARAEKDDDSKLISNTIGLSMCLERMAALLKKMELNLPPVVMDIDPTLICVCMESGSGEGGECGGAALARGAWAERLSCCVWVGGAADARDVMRARFILAHRNGAVELTFWTRDGTARHYQIPSVEVVDFIKQKLQSEKIQLKAANMPEASTSRCINWNESDKSIEPVITVEFVTNDKMTKKSKKHCENQIDTQITSILVLLGLQPAFSRVRVGVVAAACPTGCVRALAGALSAPLADTHRADLRPLVAMFPKNQDMIEETLDKLLFMVKQNSYNRSSDDIQLYAIYSIPDSVCKLIT